ncbi:inner nuclear membrane protein Man1-like isoform X2 [Asterias amurensis]|uniref:inner nuclear membrane protein Man1-like isoform X2 n=1 Tax=Asterias amurensis TaxID=7602 RepID=UPI003AB2A797
MAASGHTALNDRELRTELKRLGFNAGPVTDTTRKVYFKKLSKLQAEEKLKVKLPTPAVPGRKLLGFSSDESDGESAGNRRRSTPVPSKGLRRRSLKVRAQTPHNGTADDHGDTPAKSTKLPSEGSRLNSSSKSKRYSTGMLPSAGPSIDRTVHGNKSRARASLLAGRDAVTKSRVVPTPSKGEFSDSDVDEKDNNEEEDEDSNDELTEPQMTEASTNSSNSKYDVRNRNSRGRMNETYTKDHVNSEASDLSSTGNKTSGLWWSSTAKPSPRQSLPKSLTPRTSTPRKSNRLRLSDAYDDEVDTSQLNDNAARNNNSNTLAPASRNNLNSSRNPNLNQIKSSSSSKVNNVSLPRSTSSSFLNSKSNHTPRSRPYAYQQPDRSKSSTSNPRNSDLPEREENLYEEFATEDHSASSLGSRIGHHVPMILLSCAFLFFVVLGMVYMNVGTENLEDSRHFYIAGNTDEMDHIEAMKIVQALYVKLSDLAGKYECKAPDVTSNNMTFDEAKLFLKFEFSEIKKQKFWMNRHLEGALQKIVNNTQWGLRLYNSEKEPLTVEEGRLKKLTEQTIWLESLQPQMSWLCRVQRSAVLVVFRLVVFALVVLVLWLVYKYTMYRIKRDRDEKQRMLELVDEINEMLRSHQMAYNKDKSLSPYLALPHVRDTLIPLKHRREKQRLWDKAVLFINTHESRVRMETQQIAGEEFLVWRWILPSPVVASFTPMTELELNPNRVKVWQGTAFDNLDTAIKTPRYTPTPCLKIRNMFDPTLEADGDWHVTIEDAILERCADNEGIVHVAVDRTSREGCVYVKCATPDSAGRAYRALQGSWFDGKLVTVKYLRLDRYHQRFPYAVNYNAPLRPSNNLKKSLSHPGQSSSLESS